MHTSDRFLKFAAECQVMAKFSPSSENRAVWRGLAQRWIRCAELMDHQDLENHSRRSLKRHLKAVHPVRHTSRQQGDRKRPLTATMRFG